MPGADPSAAFRLDELAQRTGASLEGDGATRIDRVATLQGAGEGAIAFLANPRYRGQLAATRASAVIVSPADARSTPRPKLVTHDPYAVYAKVAQLLYPVPSDAPGVHATAIVDPAASIDASATLGPHVVIGARAQVGARAVLGPGVVVGADARLHEDVRLNANVVVYAGCVVGPRTVIHAGAVVGADGFGMAQEGGRWLRIPQDGRVVSGADCEIGANTTIVRGAIEDTVIEDDVKLDNQIQVGHNCRIGRHTAIAGCVGIAGSTRIGRDCQIGGAAMIAGHLDIPDGTVVYGGTTIIASPPSRGTYASIFPQLDAHQWRRVAVQLRRLDAIAERLQRLERAALRGDEDVR
jgi:UDP-3-O-[3-hydroxymyristoyl] glucosamine N-acyltransferase